jgi:hypothetical protein
MLRFTDVPDPRDVLALTFSFSSKSVGPSYYRASQPQILESGCPSLILTPMHSPIPSCPSRSTAHSLSTPSPPPTTP